MSYSRKIMLIPFGSVIRQTVWHKKLVTVNNKRTGLDHIEHKIIRPLFKDPRSWRIKYTEYDWSLNEQ